MSIQEELCKFCGTENYYPVFLGVVCTDGVQYFREKLNAFWVFSDASVICRNLEKTEGFIVFKVKSKEQKAVINYEDGNGKKLYTQSYDYTDLIEGEYLFYYVQRVFMLPGEY